MKKLELRKTSPRRMLYLVAIAIGCSLGLLCHQAWLKLYRDNHKADQAFLSTHLKQDTEAARYAFYANYSPKTDYINNASFIDSNATFLNVCNNNDTCALLTDRKDILNVCSQLSSKYRFRQHRVYNCNVKVTLENDQPLTCKAINRDTFDNFCSRFTFLSKKVTFVNRDDYNDM